MSLSRCNTCALHRQKFFLFVLFSRSPRCLSTKIHTYPLSTLPPPPISIWPLVGRWLARFGGRLHPTKRTRRPNRIRRLASRDESHLFLPHASGPSITSLPILSLLDFRLVLVLAQVFPAYAVRTTFATRFVEERSWCWWLVRGTCADSAIS